MKKYLIFIACLIVFSDVYSAGRPLRVIRCVERDQVDAPAFAQKGTDRALKMLDSTGITNQFCYPGTITFEVSPFDCTNPRIASEVITVKILGDTLIAGDGLTINTITNANFTDGTSALVDDFDPMAPVGTARIAVVAVTPGEIEIEFTRDPTQETVITFRNAVTADMTGALTIPACDPADLAIGAASIPTIGEWAGIILAIMMLIFGVVATKQKRGTLIPVKERVKK